MGQAFLGVRDTQGRDLGVGKSILAPEILPILIILILMIMITMISVISKTRHMEMHPRREDRTWVLFWQLTGCLKTISLAFLLAVISSAVL